MKRLGVSEPAKCIGCYSCMSACARYVFHATGPGVSALHISYRGIQPTINYCRSCANAPCAAGCPTGALSQLTGGGVHFNEHVCVHCGRCINNCSSGALKWHREAKKPLVCNYCGMCARFCPRDVLIVEESHEQFAD